MPKTLMGPNQTHETPQPRDDFFNKENQRSLWNLIPESMHDSIYLIPEHLLGMSEHEHRKKLKPDRTLERIRIAFWLEYDRAQGNMDKMRMSSVYSSVVSKQYWCTHILENQRKLAYILTPPADYIIAMREILMHGVEVMRDIVTAKDIVGPGGKLNAKNAEVALKAIEMAHIRVYGAPIIRTKNESVSVSHNVNQNISPPKNVEELKRELEMLRSQSTEALGPSVNVVETVTVKDVAKVEGTNE